ncbi:RNA-binding cell elongation regulator Jag/EloR [Petrotoga sibirica]|uniref:SpoIIIJ-associated protein n=2 Tax=Petrotoga sibirica TaxID=156202 RepID=A0A4V3GQG3_9BACT|nr:RNA-binding cell elongation regulator Jag/EloR [Petrotoga sibirica]POZ88584.1 single-stranded DNA-binding protein [Petrotoga sibirica DSM 13575]TDX14943.1 spoIIIJ-associated protein [Petrotoga sibirica]
MLKLQGATKFEGTDLESVLEIAKTNFNASCIDEISYKIIQEPSKGFLGIGKKPLIIEAYPNEKYLINRVKNFLKNILSYFEEDVDININYHNKNLKVFLEGENLGKVIGKQGRNLGALQHLTMIYVNRMTDTKCDVKLDVGDYRKNRKKNLELIADNAAKKAIMTNDKVELAPMFSFERKIIHKYINYNYPRLRTVSMGLEPYRKVVIYPSKNGHN